MQETDIMLLWFNVRNFLGSAAKPFFQLILLATFLYFFGLPAIERYRKKEVLVVEKKRDTGEILEFRGTLPFDWKLNLLILGSGHLCSLLIVYLMKNVQRIEV